MKFNISYPQHGTQKCIEIDDDKKCSIFFDKRMGQEVEVDALGDEYKGYIFKITGGNDKQGFPMKQGILVNGRPQVLMGKGHKCYRPRRTGEKKRKSVRGCIVGSDIRVLAVTVVKKGEKDIEGVTNVVRDRRLAPKRASKLRKLFGIKRTEKNHNILTQKVAIRRTFQSATGKNRQKAANIQRLITEARLRRKRISKKYKKDKWQKTKQAEQEYHKWLTDWRKKKEAKKSAEIARKKSSEEGKRKSSEEASKKPATKAGAQTTTQAQTKPKKSDNKQQTNKQ